MNIKIWCFICIAIISCKSTDIEKHTYTKNCFYIDNGYAFLNLYNSGNKDIHIQKFTIIRNEDLTIVKNNYKLKNDTLFIRSPTADDVSISDAKNPIITIIKDSIQIKKGESIKDAFKIRESFKIIVLKNGDANLILENCVN